MKICSLLPSATEILFALGLGEQVCGVSHECDFPPEARSRPVLIKSRISHTESAAAIDRQVREFLERSESLYSVDFEQLRAIEPDIIVTQDLCHVCAATPDDLGCGAGASATSAADCDAQSSFSSRCLRGYPHRGLTRRDESEQANALIVRFEAEIAKVESSVAGLHRPRVLCLEWLDPPYVAGHWVPEMVARAGGIDVLGQAGKPSFRVDWEAALAARPDVIVIMPCGYSLADADAEFRNLPLPQRCA